MVDFVEYFVTAFSPVSASKQSLNFTMRHLHGPIGLWSTPPGQTALADLGLKTDDAFRS